MKIFSKRLPATMVKKLVIPSIGVLALVIFSSFILFEATKSTIDITKNGERETVRTHTNTVEELLEEQGIVVEKYDWLSHDIDAKIKNGMAIEYKKAEEIIVTIDGEEEAFYTTRELISEFLEDEDLIFAKHDELSFDVTDKIVPGLALDVTTAFKVIINDGGEKQAVWTTGGLVSDLLDDHNIKLKKKLDKIKPALSKSVKEDTLITITRVEKITDTIEEKIDFKIDKQEDASLAKGKEKVISEGKPGMVVKTFEITKENGEEVNRELQHEEIKVASENRVVMVGTKVDESPKQGLVTLGSKQENGSASSLGGEVFYMNATAYSANCSGCSGITATGIDLRSNPNLKVIAVDPSVIPLGTKVWVEGYGEAIAGDTGGSIRGNRIDVHVPTKEDASRYGWQKVEVRIIN